MLDPRWGRIEREVALAAFGISLDTFDPWVLDRFTDLFDEQYVPAGQVLWSAGERVELLYFMHQGRVRAVREGVPPWIFDGRWFLGTYEGHLDSRANRTMVAEVDFHALRIRRRAWLDLLEDSFELTRRGVVEAATAVAEFDERLPTGAESTLATVPPPLQGPLTMIDRLAFLTELEMTRGVGVQALANLAEVSEPRTFREGEALFRPGDAVEHFHLVVDGSIEGVREGLDVRRQYGSGDVVAGAAALSDHVRHWSAYARTPARVLAVPLEAWFDLMEEHFDLAHSTLFGLANERERLLERLAEDAGPEGLVLK